MKNALLTSGLILIALLAMFNCSMLYDDYGIGLWISAIFSTIGIPLPLLLLFIRSNSKWVLPTLSLALITLSLPIIISEYHSSIFKILESALIPFNVLLATLCIISVASVTKVDHYSKST